MFFLLILGIEDLKLCNMLVLIKVIIYIFIWYVGKIIKFFRI